MVSLDLKRKKIILTGVVFWSVNDQKYCNEGFVSKAPAAVVEAEKAKLAELEGQLATMNTQIEQLKAL